MPLTESEKEIVVARYVLGARDDETLEECADRLRRESEGAQQRADNAACAARAKANAADRSRQKADSAIALINLRKSEPDWKGDRAPRCEDCAHWMKDKARDLGGVVVATCNKIESGSSGAKPAIEHEEAYGDVNLVTPGHFGCVAFRGRRYE